jgi:hypothetical protein
VSNKLILYFFQGSVYTVDLINNGKLGSDFQATVLMFVMLELRQTFTIKIFVYITENWPKDLCQCSLQDDQQLLDFSAWVWYRVVRHIPTIKSHSADNLELKSV